MSINKNCVALIPARAGSQRIPDKNIKELNGHPLIAYSIAAAKESKIFSDIICITDSPVYADIAKHYGASVPDPLRPESLSGSLSPDIEWVSWILAELNNNKNYPEVFSILRPTSPFRSAKTIRDGYKAFMDDLSADSLRAIELTSQHPGKMWMVRNNRMLPLLPFDIDGVAWHSSQYANLPEIFIQNASLEFAYTKIVTDLGSISGECILPFFTRGLEGFDINTPEDWTLAETYFNSNQAELPEIQYAPYNN